MPNTVEVSHSNKDNQKKKSGDGFWPSPEGSLKQNLEKQSCSEVLNPTQSGWGQGNHTFTRLKLDNVRR